MRMLLETLIDKKHLKIKINQEILEIDYLKKKYELLISHLMREKEILSLGRKIQTEARDKIGKAQRDYYLREQLKVIKKELGKQMNQSLKPSNMRPKSKKRICPQKPEKKLSGN